MNRFASLPLLGGTSTHSHGTGGSNHMLHPPMLPAIASQATNPSAHTLKKNNHSTTAAPITSTGNSLNKVSQNDNNNNNNINNNNNNMNSNHNNKHSNFVTLHHQNNMNGSIKGGGGGSSAHSFDIDHLISGLGLSHAGITASNTAALTSLLSPLSNTNKSNSENQYGGGGIGGGGGGGMSGFAGVNSTQPLLGNVSQTHGGGQAPAGVGIGVGMAGSHAYNTHHANDLGNASFYSLPDMIRPQQSLGFVCVCVCV